MRPVILNQLVLSGLPQQESPIHGTLTKKLIVTSADFANPESGQGKRVVEAQLSLW